MLRVAGDAPVGPDVSTERGAELCFECSVERGGRYDDATDRWVVPPRTEGLFLSAAS